MNEDARRKSKPKRYYRRYLGLGLDQDRKKVKQVLEREGVEVIWHGKPGFTVYFGYLLSPTPESMQRGDLAVRELRGCSDWISRRPSWVPDMIPRSRQAAKRMFDAIQRNNDAQDHS